MSVWHIYRIKDKVVNPQTGSDTAATKQVLFQRENILDEYGTITLDQIKESIKLVKEYGPPWLVWAINLTHKYIAASCEKELKERIDERFKLIPEEEKGKQHILSWPFFA